MIRFLIFILLPFYSFSQGIIAGDTISPTIYYNNIKDTLLPFIARATTSCDIDIDGDNINDIRFLNAHSSSPAFSSIMKSILSLTNIEYAYLSNISYADTIPIGDTINRSYNWKNSSISLFYSFSGPPPPWGPGYVVYGSFRTANNYLGFRKIFPNDTIYGWILLDATNTIKIKSYAFEKKCSAFPDPSISTTSTILCIGETATLTANGAATYTWSTMSNSNTIVVNPNVTTSYSLISTDVLGCVKSAIVTLTVEACIGIKEIQENEISIFPNPSNQFINIYIGDVFPQNIQLSLMNSLGEKLLQISNADKIDVSNINEGIYYLQMVTKDSRITKKIIIQH